jgi:hypothetical protein
MRMMHEYCASLGLMPEASMCRKTASASSIVEGPGRDGEEEAGEVVREAAMAPRTRPRARSNSAPATQRGSGPA